MQRHLRFRIVSLLTAAVWTAAIAQLFLNKKMPSRSQLTVTLTSEPKRVRIQIRGERPQTRQYVDTPINLSLAPGRRRIRVSRPGYRGHDMIVEGAAGEQINIGPVVLERDPTARFGLVEIKPQGKGILFEINDRLVTNDQVEGPIELLHGAEHELIASLVDSPESGTASCRFNLREAAQSTPQMIYIRRIKGRGGKVDSLRITPCNQLVPNDRPRSSKATASDNLRSDTE